MSAKKWGERDVEELRQEVSAVVTQAALDAAIRHDCELIAAWETLMGGFDHFATDRQDIIAFVLNRRGVVERPAWSDAWVKGE